MFSNEYFSGYGGLRWHGGHRAKRGNMGPIILKLLMEKPMHGYEIISKLEEKSHGLWRPSAGSIYPNLQLLEEQELVKSNDKDGKKIYKLTVKGKSETEKIEEVKAPWEDKFKHTGDFVELKTLAIDNIHLVKRIISQDSDKKIELVKKLLTETRDKLSKMVDDD